MPGPSPSAPQELTQEVEQARVVTLLDVARDAGVSRATASRVLAGSPRVSPHARERVTASAERLRYQVNAAARSLRTSRTGLVGLLIPGYRNDLFGPIADRLDARLREHDLSVIIGSSDWSAAGDLRILESFVARRLDAMILAPSFDQSKALAAHLGHLRTPVVLLDRSIPGLERDTVLTGLGPAIFDALAHLARLGHHRIAVTAYGTHLRPGREVRRAFTRGIRELGLAADPALMVPMISLDPSQGAQVADALLDAGPTAVIVGGPTALLAACLRRIREQLGAHAIPQRLSVIAVGDDLIADLHDPPLDLVTRPVDRIADALADTLLRRLQEPSSPVQDVQVPLGYRPGASISPPASIDGERD